jgi:hypothetical protein
MTITASRSARRGRALKLRLALFAATAAIGVGLAAGPAGAAAITPPKSCADAKATAAYLLRTVAKVEGQKATYYIDLHNKAVDAAKSACKIG